MADDSSRVPIRHWASWWLILGVTLLAIQAVGALIFVSGAALRQYHNSVLVLFLFLLLGGVAVSAHNAIRNRYAIRLFWSFLGASFFCWALNQSAWVYYSVVRGMPLPPYVVGAVPLLLRMMFLTAAVGCSPHLESLHDRPRNAMNLLAFLVFLLVLFEFFQFPFRYAQWAPEVLLQRQVLYVAMSLTLFVGLGAALVTAQSSWKALYGHLLGASVLYGVGSWVSNLAISPGQYIAGLQDLGYMAAAYWFIWIALWGGERQIQFESDRWPGTPARNITGILVILAMSAVPIIALWELYRAEESDATRLDRLEILVWAVVLLAFSALLILYIKKRKFAREMDHMGGRLLEAQEEERARIARELHDDINQRIAVLAINLDQLKQQLPESAIGLHPLLHENSQRLSDLAKDIQALSHRLHSSKLEYLGLAKAAESFCREFSEQAKVTIDFHCSDIPAAIPKQVALCLFRVLQESLQNAAKHSGAKVFDVQLCAVGDDIRLTVHDQGVGFEPQSVANGLGLISMRERLHMAGGHFAIRSAVGRGTIINARVPITPEDHHEAEAGNGHSGVFRH